MTSPENGSPFGDGSFGRADRYDAGISPDVAVNATNTVVEVHQSQNASTLWYHVGRVDGDTIDWSGSVRYDDGVNPSVAIANDGLVVEVHQSQNASTLWYHVGRVNVRTPATPAAPSAPSPAPPSTAPPSPAPPSPAPSPTLPAGRTPPSTEPSTGPPMTVPMTEPPTTGETIGWSDSVQYDDGVNPSVAITNDGLVVEVHQSQNANTLWYHVGRVNGDTIDWSDSVQYDDGVNPTVAITNDGLVVEVHQGGQGDAAGCWSRGVGQVDGDTINWSDDKSLRYGSGEAPVVACNTRAVVEAHTTDKILFCSVLALPALRSGWIDLYGANSYSYCSCNNTTDPDQRHTSSHALNVEAGAPYLYVVLTRGVDNAEFPTGALMTVTGPGGTTYDRDAQDDNQLVIMSGSSVQCLIVKNPAPGDWTMTMDVPAGVGFWCVCNTVPSADVYRTIDSTARLNRRFIATTTLLFAAAIAALAVVVYRLRNSPQPATVAGLTAAMYAGLRPETAAWVSSFMWGSSPSDPPPMGTRTYHEFITDLAQRLTSLADGLENSGYGVFDRFSEYVSWFGKNFSEQEYNVVRNADIPVDRVLFVYALVYFEVRHMTDAEEQNAVRHALWQCYLKKTFGADLATQIGDAHEEARPGTDADNLADEINNVKGQQLADQVKAPYQCFEAARQMWRRGELQTRTDLEGDPT